MYRVYRHAFLENVPQANECFQASLVLVIIVCVCVCVCVYPTYPQCISELTLAPLKIIRACRYEPQLQVPSFFFFFFLFLVGMS